MDTPEPLGHPKVWEPPDHPAAGVEWFHHFQLGALPLAQHLAGVLPSPLPWSCHHCPATTVTTVVLPQLLTQSHSSSHWPNWSVTSGVSPPAGPHPTWRVPHRRHPCVSPRVSLSCVSPQIPTMHPHCSHSRNPEQGSTVPTQSGLCPTPVPSHRVTLADNIPSVCDLISAEEPLFLCCQRTLSPLQPSQKRKAQSGALIAMSPLGVQSHVPSQRGTSQSLGCYV